MAPKILVVLSSFDKIQANNHPTGWYLPEFAHPWSVLHDKADLTIASPKGGAAPLDPSSVEMFKNDPISSKFLNEQEALWKNTHKLEEFVDRVDEFDAIFYVGGHGPMFDLTTDKTSIALIHAFAEKKKPISAVCHGPCVFVNVTTPSGASLIEGAEVTGFSNEEEDQVQLSSVMPFMLEDELRKRSGGKYVKADQAWGEKVVTSKVKEYGGVIVTGQNPASAGGVGEALAKALGI
ncbi:class I glutamine amidotransferase-like protein [Aspergillus karnatakaensis]|uniref:type 1 glutamine amidotransferase domain-containing protein n=1 Tax=Aspergillus karnatakaensis TaxID=1810916 RepID=UPI003CCD3568